MNRSLDGEKIVLYIVCFANLLLSVVVVVAVVVFPLFSFQTVFISTPEFYILSISFHHPTGGQVEG